MKAPTLALVAFALAACAAPPKAPATTTSTWESSTWEERHATMTWTVLPNMGRLFQRHLGTESPELTCRTCHGKDAEAVAYAMPHGLVALDPDHLPHADAPAEAERKTALFMDEVTTSMRALLDAAPYDPKAKRGFSCFSCHPAVRR